MSAAVTTDERDTGPAVARELLRSVTVREPVQVVHDGVVYVPGEIVPNVVASLAYQWFVNGWVTDGD
jgi:hypothetical protein